MKVSIFGLGYVGFTAMCCIAKDGHQVIGFDVNATKVKQINNNIPPIVEPGVSELLTKGLENKKIAAFTEIGNHLDECDIAIVCVGTPSNPDGSHNMSYIAEVSRQIAMTVNKDRPFPLTVVYRSTIRPGTMEELIKPIFTSILEEDYNQLIELVYNPEFLRESSAINDYYEPPKIVIGTKDAKPSERMNILNEKIKAPVFHVHYKEAEITKFIDNSWHALKVAYANEIGRVCLELNINAAKVHEIFISDTKLNISAYYMRPGGAFGGSCLPKDVRALQHISANCGANTHLINSILPSNEAHKDRLFQLATKNLSPNASILLVGIAFKANTDDLRESPGVDIARNLLDAGFNLSIFDPAIKPSNLIGVNLGYSEAQLPTLSKLLVNKQEAEDSNYDRIIVTNATFKQLNLNNNQDIIDINALS